MRVGILGAGGMGNVHARQYRKIEGIDLGFYDVDRPRSQALAEAWQANVLEGFDELIRWADVVDICLPTDAHCQAGLAAIANGKAVFIEKPLGSTFEEGVQLLEASDKAQVPFGVGQVVRYFPEFAAANRAVKAGEIGKAAAVRTRRGGAAPTGKGGWFLDHARSGGVLLDLAIHDFDWLRWTFGEVSHLYARSVGAATGQGPDYALTVLTFESGVIGHVEATWMDPSGFRTTFEVAGSDGFLAFDSRQTPSLRVLTAEGSALECNLTATDDPYYKEITAFLDAVKTGKKPPVSAHDGLMALSIALAALESAKTGKVVSPARP